MRVAYADPPYVGQAKKHYSDDPRAAEVNLPVLVGTLCEEFPDGWALSASAPSLRDVLNLCPDDVRVGVWVKPFAVFKPGVNPAYSWEPVIFRGGRKRGRELPTLHDHVISSITLRRGTVGAKPTEFCLWVFRFLGLQPEDEFVDLFPGSGAVTKVWEEFAGGYHEMMP